MTDIAPIYKGWNVWSVYQVTDLDFSVAMIGINRDTQLRIWVEDQIRLNATEATVADIIDFKGSQIQILNGKPLLVVAVRKEQISGPAMLLDGPAELRYVRFFNRGNASQLLWPHDDNYLLNEVYRPSTTDPLTTGGGPLTTTDNVTKPLYESVSAMAPWLILGVLGFFLVKSELDG